MSTNQLTNNIFLETKPTSCCNAKFLLQCSIICGINLLQGEFLPCFLDVSSLNLAVHHCTAFFLFCGFRQARAARAPALLSSNHAF
ncbi:hypothetical protein SAMN02746095_00736 [Acidocella aminolytica 101 = DSM 11237]|nr:hypothetical protein SAMN02746095_00736 [Acidocella aminolytica 101 = DSM 11237]